MLNDFRQTQATFAAYIRDPEHNPVPQGVNPQRMAIYRELFFNNIQSFLSTNFPVLHTILTEQECLDLAQAFFSQHQCETPHFSEIPEEFITFLQNTDVNLPYPFLLELAHYEWVETAVMLSKAEIVPIDTAFTDNIDKYLINLSPLVCCLVYQFPVQNISANYLPDTPPAQPTYLVVYRDVNDEVHFLQTTLMTYYLLQKLEENPNISAVALIDLLIKESNYPNPGLIHKEGLKILHEMALKGIVIQSDI